MSECLMLPRVRLASTRRDQITQELSVNTLHSIPDFCFHNTEGSCVEDNLMLSSPHHIFHETLERVEIRRVRSPEPYQHRHTSVSSGRRGAGVPHTTRTVPASTHQRLEWKKGRATRSLYIVYEYVSLQVQALPHE